MDVITLLLLISPIFLQTRACSDKVKMNSVSGCGKDFIPMFASLVSETVTYQSECLLQCKNNGNCHAVSICPDPGNSGLLFCDLFASATDGTCGNLMPAAGCRYLESEHAPPGPQCVAPRTFDAADDMCVCAPVWMTGPNCDQYYIDCTDAYEKGLRGPGDHLVMQIKPLISTTPIETKCYLELGGYTYMQYRSISCPDDLTGLGWAEFRNGFGDFGCSFYLGLEPLYQLLKNGEFRLKVKLYDESDVKGIIYYYNFTITDEGTAYTLNYDEVIPHDTAPADDGLGFGASNLVVKGSRFATFDNDNYECAKNQGTGWWYNDGCSLVNLNLPLNTSLPNCASWPVVGVVTKMVEIDLSLLRI